jgi:hypothetical protein
MPLEHYNVCVTFWWGNFLENRAIRSCDDNMETDVHTLLSETDAPSSRCFPMAAFVITVFEYLGSATAFLVS